VDHLVVDHLVVDHLVVDHLVVDHLVVDHLVVDHLVVDREVRWEPRSDLDQERLQWAVNQVVERTEQAGSARQRRQLRYRQQELLHKP